MSDFSFVEEVVHRDTQISGDVFDLTAGEVYTVEEPGRVDFGGGELQAAELESVETVKRDGDDDYGWWNLDGGVYLLEHNESLDGGRTVRLETRQELLARGAFHPSVTVDSLTVLPLSVANGGVRVKENARVSTIRVVD